MTSTDPKPTKRRVGRRRNPPLPPPPAFQFVVANHPNDFKATQTLREVRSHVMYRHRENQGSSPTELGRSREGSSAPGTLARTPSPVSIDSIDVLQTNALPESTTGRGYSTALCQDTFNSRTLSASTDPVRDLAAQILSAANPKPPHSAPPACEGASEYPFPGYNALTNELSDDTKREWIRTTSFFCHDRIWMRSICDSHLSFLSHVYTTLVYQDIDEGLLYDSDLTVFAKTMIIRLISSRLDTDDATIICILHLLISEIGGTDEDVFNVHQDGLMTCLRNQQGGVNPSLARSMTLVMLTYAIARGQPEPRELTPWFPTDTGSNNDALITPLISPLEHSLLYRTCSVGTAGIILEIQKCTNVFLARWNHNRDALTISSGQLANCDSQLQNIYSRILLLPSTEGDITPDWIYESCRIAALIYCRSVVHGTSFASSGRIVHATTPGSRSESATLLSALYTALEKTDTRGCWGSGLSGTFLWATLVGAAAAWSSRRPLSEDDSPTSTWAGKCFALYAMRAAVSVPFQQADAAIHALRTFLQVRRWVAVKSGSFV